MQLRMKLIIVAVAAALVGLITAFLVYKFSPSKEVMPLTEYYQNAADELTLIVQNELSEDKGRYLDGVPYVKYELVKERFNKRFYWAANDGIIIYTTPVDIIKVTPDEKEYSVNKNKMSSEYAPVKMIDGTPYMAVPFVKEYSDIEYQFFENPNRIIINCEWGINQLCSKVEKEASLRVEPDIKSPILEELQVGAAVTLVDSPEEIGGGFVKVISEDGVIGYVKNSRLEESEYNTTASSYQPPEYTHITKDYDICLAWHQVSNQAANEGLLDLLNSSKGVNTISPTWFKLADSEGNVDSIASEKYVARAHEAGVEVWGLCSDFKEGLDTVSLYSSTKAREKLENKLISLAIEYGLDGINIDFEKVNKESGEDYIQFLRELSVKCRTNGIVLSIDDYVPMEFRAYYDYEEQGVLADYVAIMAYDEHYAGGAAGSVSSISFVNNAVSGTQKYIPPERIIMGLPFYTRLWKITTGEDGKEQVASEAYGMKGATDLLNQNEVTPNWDEITGQYYAEFRDGVTTCKMWLENERSIEEKLKAVTSGGIKNVAFWRLGFANTETWNVIGNYINVQASGN